VNDIVSLVLHLVLMWVDVLGYGLGARIAVHLAELMLKEFLERSGVMAVAHMTTGLPEELLSWVKGEIGFEGCGCQVRKTRKDSNTWRIRIDGDKGQVEAVLRMAQGGITEANVKTNAAALKVAEHHGLSAPRLLACDLLGSSAGIVASLETAEAGTSELPRQISTKRLYDTGAALSRIHRVSAVVCADLPERIRPTESNDYAMLRRWGSLYAALGNAAGQASVIEAFCRLTGWDKERATRRISASVGSVVLQFADERIRYAERPRETRVLLHGDVWGGNMLWSGDDFVCFVDWKEAGVGDPGIDLSELRLQVALQYGYESAEHVVDGWSAMSDLGLPDLPFWDVVAALNTPLILAGWPGFDRDGERISHAAVSARRDDFLKRALRDLGESRNLSS
jgi:aminoglycoside phosphotransferase (APT) family kinase protein